MSVNRCGDTGCPCRNLPTPTDDGPALRAEVQRLRVTVARVRALCREYAAETEPVPAGWVARQFRAVLDGAT